MQIKSIIELIGLIMKRTDDWHLLRLVNGADYTITNGCLLYENPWILNREVCFQDIRL